MKKRYVIEFTVEAEDCSDEWIKDQALQELTCMAPFPEDIDFYRKDNPWHTEEPVRMTNRQLAEWLAKGFGEHTYEGGSSYSDICWDYLLMVENDSVSDDVLIRSWDSDEWVKPTVDIYERDCKSYCRTTLA